MLQLKIFQNNEYRVSEQELTLLEKEKVWAETYSGSQMNMLMYSPAVLFNQKKTGKKPIFGQIVKDAMYLGTIMEKPIIDEFNKRSKEWQTVVDKRTFFSTNNSLFSANIDGFIMKKDESKNLSNIKGIFESKCVAEGTPESVAHTYMAQLQFYMWFFGVSFAFLGMLIKKTNRFHFLKIPFDKEYQQNMMIKLGNFLNILEKYDSYPIIIEDTEKVWNVEKEAVGEKIQALAETKEKIKELTQLEKEQKAELKTLIPKKISICVGVDFIWKKTEFVKRVIDYPLFRDDVEKKYNNGMAWEDFDKKYLTPQTVSYWKFSKKKGK